MPSGTVTESEAGQIKMRNHSRGPNGKFTSFKDNCKSLPIAGET